MRLRKLTSRRKNRGPRFAIEWLEARTLPANVPPVAHWTFDEGAGTVATDTTGNGHNATLGAGVSWGAGNVGSHSISTTGTATGLATATGPVVNTAGSFT